MCRALLPVESSISSTTPCPSTTPGTPPTPPSEATSPQATTSAYWTGNGIVFSPADAHHSIGITDTGSAINLKYTLFGDSNLDGTVNFNDLLSLAQAEVAAVPEPTSLALLAARGGQSACPPSQNSYGLTRQASVRVHFVALCYSFEKVPMCLTNASVF